MVGVQTKYLTWEELYEVREINELKFQNNCDKVKHVPKKNKTLSSGVCMFPVTISNFSMLQLFSSLHFIAGISTQILSFSGISSAYIISYYLLGFYPNRASKIVLKLFKQL